MSTTEVEKAAARGAEWLDKKLPGWFTADKINLRTLDMSEGHCEGPRQCGCICAQLDAAYLAAHDETERGGSWWRGFTRLGRFRVHIWERTEELGFTTDPKDYDLLTKAWAREIRQRRAAAKKAA